MSTATNDDVIDIARQVATANLGSGNFTDVRSAPTVDLDGHDALQITIVLTSESTASSITGDAALNTLTQIHEGLRNVGDERFPFITFATETELTQSGD
jgi:hypothetical protein